MRPSLLSLLVLFSLPASSEASHMDPGIAGTSASTPLFESVSHRYRAVLQGVSFYCITQADRKQILEDLFRSLETDYSLIELKEKRIGPPIRT